MAMAAQSPSLARLCSDEKAGGTVQLAHGVPTRAGFHRLDRTSLSRRPTVTVNPVTGSAGRDQGL